MAFGAMVALARRAEQGGSWLVRISLAQVGKWMADLGEVPTASLAHVPAEFGEAELDSWSTVSQTPSARCAISSPSCRCPRRSLLGAAVGAAGYHRPAWPARGAA